MKVRVRNSNCQLARVSERIALHRPSPSPSPWPRRGDPYARGKNTTAERDLSWICNSFSLCVYPRPDNQHCHESLEFTGWPDCKPRTPHIRRANGRVLGLAFQWRWRKRRRDRVGCQAEARRRRQAGVDISCRKMQWENRGGAMKCWRASANMHDDGSTPTVGSTYSRTGATKSVCLELNEFHLLLVNLPRAHR